MRYIIQNTEHGGYVSQPGSRSSYTPKLQEARIYATFNAAMADCCIQNEVVLPLESAFQR